MPATEGRKPSQNRVIGVDGCRGGWVLVELELPTAALRVDFAPAFGDVLSGRGADAALIIVDMPIGLVDSGRRACEAAARARLGRPRSSSVFAAPRRPMLAYKTRAEASAWGMAQGRAAGGGLSIQAWHILGKIAEIDQVVSPRLQSKVGEGHPEVAFLRLNGGRACAHRKVRSAGRTERLQILAKNGLAVSNEFLAEAKAVSGGRAKPDDVLDACALALTAKARLEGQALHLTDGARDARGLVMEIWG